MSFYDPRVGQPYVILTYIAPERDPGAQRDAAALTLLSEILGGGQTSVLTQKLQFEPQTAVYAGAFYNWMALDGTSFGLNIVPSEGVSLQKAEDALDHAILEFIETGVDQDKLECLKMQFRASEIYARDNVKGLANTYGMTLASGLRLEDIDS